MVFWPLTFKILDDSCALRRCLALAICRWLAEVVNFLCWAAEPHTTSGSSSASRWCSHRSSVRVDETGIGWWEMGVILELRLPSQRSFTSFFGFLFRMLMMNPKLAAFRLCATVHLESINAWQAISACAVGTFIVGFWYRSMWIGCALPCPLRSGWTAGWVEPRWISLSMKKGAATVTFECFVLLVICPAHRILNDQMIRTAEPLQNLTLETWDLVCFQCLI